MEALKKLEADLQIVVAFRMLPEVVWNMPRLGTVNAHASLLPQYRGCSADQLGNHEWRKGNRYYYIQTAT
jgi:methionyl-tRNA formyltransferase